MNQNFDHPSYKVLVTGCSGTGKTTLFERLIRKEKAQWKFIYDHQGEFAARFNVPCVATAAALEEKTLKKGWVVFDPLHEFAERPPTKEGLTGLQQGFEFFCEYVFLTGQNCAGRKLLCCDELQSLTDNRNPPAPLVKVCEMGQRLQIDVFCISQAPNRIHNSLRNQFTDVYTFRQSDETAIKYLVDNGFDDNEVRNLAKFEYVHRNLRTGEVKKSRESL